MSHLTRRTSAHQSEKGIVLPIALIMLVILSFAGLMAARKSSTFEQISNNLRTNQVARQSAEYGLRYCEKAVIDMVDNKSAVFGTPLTSKIIASALANDQPTTVANGSWNTVANWIPGAANLITDSTYSGKAPSCIIETMSSSRYLITSRGLSNDAVVDSITGVLTSGSEVWLQSILTPQAPITSSKNGVS